MDIKFLIAPLMYAVSIYIDVFTYHLKFNLHDNKNFRYLFSLINVFQYSARGFILIFAPIMAYYTESVKDKDLIWLMTLLAHIFVILLLIMLYSRRYSLAISRFIISKLNLQCNIYSSLLCKKTCVGLTNHFQSLRIVL